MGSPKFILRTLLLTFLLQGLLIEVSAQCKNFTKVNCIPKISPYINNGQFNGASLFAGESASLAMTFYSGQKYRLLVCIDKRKLGGGSFTVSDEDGNELFDSATKGLDYFDFQVGSTQQLTINVTIPDSKTTHDLKPTGCVSILVGFKDE